ncbi:hypothetical protein IMSAGC017_00370 [Thomasclavelia cocleata]|uniref:Uncharacterized protein n=2 Tax=Thomasclavelia cocleata TaxID=69824 RepID=A0A829ZAA4_9FIRM|nr:hypothetical protein IMSAGC017_00370 [Thomasclavelia cocleata]
MMKKDSSIKFSILNITGLILFQIVHILLEIKKASIVNTEKLTQNQIMYQMRYSNIQNNLSYITSIFIFFIVIVLFLSTKNKKIHNVLIIISMGFTYIFDLNIGNVFENIAGLPVLLVFLIIIYLYRKFNYKKTNLN